MSSPVFPLLIQISNYLAADDYDVSAKPKHNNNHREPQLIVNCL